MRLVYSNVSFVNRGEYVGAKSKKSCDHNCDQALIKAGGVLYRVYIY